MIILKENENGRKFVMKEKRVSILHMNLHETNLQPCHLGVYELKATPSSTYG